MNRWVGERAAVSPDEKFLIREPSPLDSCDALFYRSGFCDQALSSLLAFAGTYHYTVWATVLNGMKGSGCAGDAGEFTLKGVYCSPLLSHASHYAVPTELFGDGILIGAVLVLDVNEQGILRERSRNDSRHELCVDAAFVRVIGVLFQIDIAASQGTHRVCNIANPVDPLLEAIPPQALRLLPPGTPVQTWVPADVPTERVMRKLV